MSSPVLAMPVAVSHGASVVVVPISVDSSTAAAPAVSSSTAAAAAATASTARASPPGSPRSSVRTMPSSTLASRNNPASASTLASCSAPIPIPLPASAAPVSASPSASPSSASAAAAGAPLLITVPSASARPRPALPPLVRSRRPAAAPAGTAASAALPFSTLDALSAALPAEAASATADQLTPLPAVQEALQALPSHHPAVAASRRLSAGMLMQEERLSVPEVRSPRRNRTGKRVQWRDDAGLRLCASLIFDEHHPPLACSAATGQGPLALPRPRSGSGAGASSALSSSSSSSSHGNSEAVAADSKGNSVTSAPAYAAEAQQRQQAERRAAEDSNTSPAYLPRRVSMEFDSSLLPQNSAALMAAVTRQGVQLESLCLRTPLVFLTVRVLNMAFEKHVFVRMSVDHWKSYTDVPASYLPGTADPSTDRFYATLNMPNIKDCHNLQFCIGYHSANKEFWDNNGGKNYEISLTVFNSHLRFGGLSRYNSFS